MILQKILEHPGYNLVIKLVFIPHLGIFDLTSQNATNLSWLYTVEMFVSLRPLIQSLIKIFMSVIMSP